MAQGLDALRQELDNYFGALNELSSGIDRAVPEKPEALLLYDATQDQRVPLVAGGILDQPHIWMQECALCKTARDTFAALNNAPEEGK